MLYTHGYGTHMIGQTIGHYEVLDKLGEGGMGVVYKARDVRLNRFVALKVLPASKLGDEERVRRFSQEARAASALNHPNIVTIYDIGNVDGRFFIVMEYVSGKTLDQLIPRKGMRFSEVLKIAVQAADALAAAAAAGVTHRDVKPGNIMVTDSGLVKVLDFGLAKLTESPAVAGEATATVAEPERPRTLEGTIIGTISYMSPEQAEGKPLDPRSDIFSFGAVLYEMISGRRAFLGDTPISTITSILRDDPKFTPDVATVVPRDLEKIVTRCLRKDPDRRFQHMADVRVALLELKEESESGQITSPVLAPPVARRRVLWPWLAAGAAVLAVGAFLALRPRFSPSPQPQVLRTTPLASHSGNVGAPSFSPDGNQITYSWDGDQGEVTHIYVKLIGNDTPLRLTSAAVSDTTPAWAPNGKTIAFVREDRAIYTISPIGGSERRLVEFAAIRSRPTWSQDSKSLIVAAVETPGQPSHLFVISLDTGEKRPLTFSDTAERFSPVLSPDSRRLAYYQTEADLVLRLLVANLDDRLQPQGRPRDITDTVRAGGNSLRGGLAWTADGSRLILATRGGLFRLSPDGSAPPTQLPLSADGVSSPSVSLLGKRLAMHRSLLDVNVWRFPILAPGKAGEPSSFIASPRMDRVVDHSISPDLRKIAIETDRTGVTSIWLVDGDGSNPTALATGTTLNGSPSWSPDGRWIVFDTRRHTNGQLYVVSADGGTPRRLTNNPGDDLIPCWSLDGKWIYFTSSRTGSTELFKIPAEGGQAVQLTHAGAWTPRESPDGKYVYYTRHVPTNINVATAGQSPLYRIPAAGGEETKVMDAVIDREWAPTRDGVWYIFPTAPTRSELRYFDFSTNKSTVAAVISKRVYTGLALSPDGRYLLYNQVDHSGSEILLVEDFQ